MTQLRIVPTQDPVAAYLLKPSGISQTAVKESRPGTASSGMNPNHSRVVACKHVIFGKASQFYQSSLRRPEVAQCFV